MVVDVVVAFTSKISVWFPTMTLAEVVVFTCTFGTDVFTTVDESVAFGLYVDVKVTLKVGNVLLA